MYNVVDLCREDKFVVNVLCIYHSCTVFINAVNGVLGLHATPLNGRFFFLNNGNLKSTKAHWSKMYIFIVTIREGNWIYTYSSAIQSSSGEAC